MQGKQPRALVSLGAIRAALLKSNVLLVLKPALEERVAKGDLAWNP